LLYAIFINIILPSVRFQCCDHPQESHSLTPRMERIVLRYFIV
jgi:hypothetical protein